MTITIRNAKDLELVINKMVEKVMTDEVLEETKVIIKDKVKTVVYNAGEPQEYERRSFTNGSLGDLEQIKHQYKNDVLEVTNEADFHHEFAQKPFTWGYGAVDGDKSLAYNIEYGYGKKKQWYSKPRPFIEETRQELRKGKFKRALIKGLKKCKVKIG